MKRKINTQTIFENTAATKQDKKAGQNTCRCCRKEKRKGMGKEGGGINNTPPEKKGKGERKQGPLIE